MQKNLSALRPADSPMGLPDAPQSEEGQGGVHVDMPRNNLPATLKEGSRGPSVKWLQSLLNGRGAALSTDGAFGPATKTAVASLQETAGLRSDGIVGPESWRELLGDVVSFKQNDPLWGDVPYTVSGDNRQTIGSSGCGPTCAAMIAATWCDPSVTPVLTCRAAVEGGYRTRNNGTAFAYFPAFARQWQLKEREYASLRDAQSALRYGALVVASMGPGLFTQNGHYILLWAFDPYSDVVYVLDPGSSRAERTRAASRVLKNEAKRFFEFTM